jgi:hypothetical protein
VSSELLANFVPCENGKAGTLLLGFDPILWGALRPVMNLLGFSMRKDAKE